MTKITQLGKRTIECYLPNSEITSAGTIHPISLEVELNDQLKQNINVLPSGSDCSVLKLERLKRRVPDGTGWEDSLTVKITFSNRTCPESLTIFNSYYKVRPYIPFPLQCWNCQRLGHSSNSCKSPKPRCKKCGGAHQKKDCTSEERHCVNCSGQHFANSKECPLIKQACHTEKIRITHGVTYEEARRQTANYFTPNKDRHFPTIDPSLSASGAPTSQILPQLQGYSRAVKKSSREISTQTEPQHNYIDKSFFMNLKNFIVEMFQIQNAKETQQAKSILTNSAIRNNFGIDLTKDQNNIGAKSSVSVDNPHPTEKRQRAEDSQSETDVGVLSNDEPTDTQNHNNKKVKKQKPPKIKTAQNQKSKKNKQQ